MFHKSNFKDMDFLTLFTHVCVALAIILGAVLIINAMFHWCDPVIGCGILAVIAILAKKEFTNAKNELNDR